ncbi:signal peptide peptidase SppA [Acetobacter conturbans]|uniref:Signal peptide peptidase SppA n=1 Tax=Acetobacter conturbans TaxID=1737472 RepID=A0ABX0JZ27_9PROT|nr:signal peptide peptidase SppA [Acetobacter conturbans]NHN87801.1 signal peptide peptidase SppA [Acetobacter conturbans]
MGSADDETIAYAVQRRRLRRWRIGAIAAVAGAFLVAGAAGHRGDNSPLFAGGKVKTPHLVEIKVHGMIGADVSRWTKAIAAAGKDTTAKGLLLDIDSPGGAVTGGEELHDAVERFALTKPVVASMGGLGASAGYMIALPAKKIFAERSTLTGSIGVLMEAPEFSGILGKVGVNVQELVSGPLKGQPSFSKPISPEGRIMLQGVVGNLYDQFVAMVVAGRHMPEAQVRVLADGRPYTGEQALKIGLIDNLGGHEDAQAWLAKASGVPEAAKIVEIGAQQKTFNWKRRVLGWFGGVVMSWFGLDADIFLPQANVGIDGAVSIWKP